MSCELKEIQFFPCTRSVCHTRTRTLNSGTLIDLISQFLTKVSIPCPFKLQLIISLFITTLPFSLPFSLSHSKAAGNGVGVVIKIIVIVPVLHCHCDSCPFHTLFHLFNAEHHGYSITSFLHQHLRLTKSTQSKYSFGYSKNKYRSSCDRQNQNKSIGAALGFWHRHYNTEALALSLPLSSSATS